MARKKRSTEPTFVMVVAQGAGWVVKVLRSVYMTIGTSTIQTAEWEMTHIAVGGGGSKRSALHHARKLAAEHGVPMLIEEWR